MSEWQSGLNGAYREPPTTPRWLAPALITVTVVGGLALAVVGFVGGSGDVYVFGTLLAAGGLASATSRSVVAKRRDRRLAPRPALAWTLWLVILVGVTSLSVAGAQRVAAGERDRRDNVVELPGDTVIPVTAVRNAALLYVRTGDDVDVIDRASGEVVATRPIEEIGPTNGLQPGLMEDETVSMWHGAASDVFVRVAKVDAPSQYQIEEIWAVSADGREMWRWGQDELGDDVAVWPQAGFADGAVGMVRCVVTSEVDGWVETGCRREVVEPDGSSRWVRRLPVDPTAGGPYQPLGFGLGGVSELPAVWIEQESDWDFPDDGGPIHRREITHVDEGTGRARRVFDGDYHAAIGSDRVITIREAGDGCLLRVFDLALEPVREIETPCHRDPELDGQHVTIVLGRLVAVDPWDGLPAAAVDSRTGDVFWVAGESAPEELAYDEAYQLTGGGMVHIPGDESEDPITLHTVEDTLELPQESYLGMGDRASVSIVEVEPRRPFNEDPMYDVVLTDLTTGETCGRLRLTARPPSVDDVVVLPDRCAAIVEPSFDDGGERSVYLVGEP